MNNPALIACLVLWLESISRIIDDKRPNLAKLEIARFIKYLKTQEAQTLLELEEEVQ